MASTRTRSDDDGTQTCLPECLLTQTMRGTMSPSLHLPISASPQVMRGRGLDSPEHQRTDGHPNAATSGVGYSKEQRPSLTPGRLECVAKPGQKQHGM